MYFESLEAIIKVLAELKILGISRKEKRNNIFIAVEAIRSAANDTKFYYSTLLNKNVEPNINLSKSWLSATSAVREIDTNLYERLLMKADFWANPNNWTPEQSEKNNIYLDSIIEDTDRILNKVRK